MLEWGWFPFIWMTQDDRKKIIYFSTRVDKPESVFDEVCTRFQAVAKDRSASWQRLSFFQDHKVFVDKAVEHYFRDDYHQFNSSAVPQNRGDHEAVAFAESARIKD